MIQSLKVVETYKIYQNKGSSGSPRDGHFMRKFCTGGGDLTNSEN